MPIQSHALKSPGDRANIKFYISIGNAMTLIMEQPVENLVSCKLSQESN